MARIIVPQTHWVEEDGDRVAVPVQYLKLVRDDAADQWYPSASAGAAEGVIAEAENGQHTIEGFAHGSHRMSRSRDGGLVSSYNVPDAETLFEYRPGYWGAGTEFSRGGVATQRGRHPDALIEEVAAGVLRDRHYEQDPDTGLYTRRTTLLEGESTNYHEYSDQFDQWFNNGGAIDVTADEFKAPNGKQVAEGLRQTSVTGATRWIGRFTPDITSPAGKTVTASCWIRKVSGSDPQPIVKLWYHDNDNGTTVSSDLSPDGEWQKYTFTFTLPDPLDETSFKFGLRIGWDHNGAANDNVFAVWRYGLELGEVASNVLETQDAPVTRPADEFSRPFPHAPQAMTLYAKFVTLAPLGDATNGLFTLGDSLASGAAFFAARFDSSSRVRLHYSNGTSSGSADVVESAEIGDVVELLGVLTDAGDLEAEVSVNGAASTADSASVGALPEAWDAETIALGRYGTAYGFNAFEYLGIWTGERDLAFARARAAA